MGSMPRETHLSLLKRLFSSFRRVALEQRRGRGTKISLSARDALPLVRPVLGICGVEGHPLEVATNP